VKKPDEKIIPLRIGADLHADILTAAEETRFSSRDVMRLAIRIGLLDLATAGYDLPALVMRSAEELGRSFAAFHHAQQTQPCTEPSTTAATTALSTSTDRSSTPRRPMTAGIVQLPRPPVVGALLHHSLNETTPTTAEEKTRLPVERRVDVRYDKKKKA